MKRLGVQRRFSLTTGTYPNAKANAPPASTSVSLFKTADMFPTPCDGEKKKGRRKRNRGNEDEAWGDV